MLTTLTVECIYSVTPQIIKRTIVLDIPSDTTVKHFLQRYLHGTGVFSIPCNTAKRFKVTHSVEGEVTEALLSSKNNGFASLDPPFVSVQLQRSKSMWACVSSTNLNELLQTVPVKCLEQACETISELDLNTTYDSELVLFF